MSNISRGSRGKTPQLNAATNGRALIDESSNQIINVNTRKVAMLDTNQQSIETTVHIMPCGTATRQ